MVTFGFDLYVVLLRYCNLQSRARRGFLLTTVMKQIVVLLLHQLLLNAIQIEATLDAYLDI